MTAGNGAPTRAIRTPDQRLRIFVSSTLRELEAERRAARAAIAGLRLAPVIFEHGPHAAALQAAIDRGREYGVLEAAEYALAGVPDTEAAATISAWRAEART
ncbi:DUF4062 domain-containing protein [Microbacterium limosum]|uniref:DUF4062 domain-containing protein n=1 Tax=Microbacterium limosum TaxID=3079935 RepID=A0AAU0MFJ9_9MICO|nr:DUF4062 domain-containing protein [Microbacterium sp. Y20]WOQ69333.1 DUF4062 domain-containing protein [Microbacterium sp. Y20]